MGDSPVWRLRFKHPDVGNRLGETQSTTESGFLAGLQDARRRFATEFSATLPGGTQPDETAPLHRYPASNP